MQKELDCRGLACPAPVLQTKQLIEKDRPGLIRVIVDNEAARENVSRFMGTQNYTVSFERDDGNFHVIGALGEDAGCDIPAVKAVDDEQKKIMVMVPNNRMGQGDDELGAKLVVNFLKTLKEMGDELWRLVFVNNGVKLCIDDSEVLPDLKELEQDGVTILVCGTCLTHFNLLNRKAVGETTNMLDVVTAMQLADKVISI